MLSVFVSLFAILKVINLSLDEIAGPSAVNSPTPTTRNCNIASAIIYKQSSKLMKYWAGLKTYIDGFMIGDFGTTSAA